MYCNDQLFERFGCPALLPKTPFAAHTMIPLRDVTAMKDEEENPEESGEDDCDGVVTHEDESIQMSGESTLDQENDSSLKGIVSMYRGMAADDIWTQKERENAFKKGDADSSSPSGSTSRMPPVFILSRTASSSSQEPLENIKSHGSKDSVSAGWEVMSLSQGWKTRHSADTYIVCADTSSSMNALGWGVRNVLALLAAHVPAKKTEDTPSSSSSSSSSAMAHTLDPVSATSQSTSLSSIDNSSNSGTCNIIALRGKVAKSMYACTCVEKARDFLSVITDREIGEIIGLANACVDKQRAITVHHVPPILLLCDNCLFDSYA